MKKYGLTVLLTLVPYTAFGDAQAVSTQDCNLLKDAEKALQSLGPDDFNRQNAQFQTAKENLTKLNEKAMSFSQPNQATNYWKALSANCGLQNTQMDPPSPYVESKPKKGNYSILPKDPMAPVGFAAATVSAGSVCVSSSTLASVPGGAGVVTTVVGAGAASVAGALVGEIVNNMDDKTGNHLHEGILPLSQLIWSRWYQLNGKASAITAAGRREIAAETNALKLIREFRDMKFSRKTAQNSENKAMKCEAISANSGKKPEQDEINATVKTDPASQKKSDMPI